MNILVAGAGYLGLPLALSLREQGHRVWGWVASEKSAEPITRAGVEPIVGDLAASDIWRKFTHPWDAIFYCASTSGGGTEAYDRVHRAGLDNALQYLGPRGSFFYTSSTSVYGQNDGKPVDEFSLTEPRAEGSKILLEAEAKVVARGGTVLRLAGIYGPGRCVYLQKMREGRATLPGNGNRWVNQIHRDDAVSALRFLGEGWKGGEIWNVADDDPVSITDLYGWLSHETGLPLPGEGGEEKPGKRGVTNKKVLNGKLRKAGWEPKYPSFREGYRELL